MFEVEHEQNFCFDQLFLIAPATLKNGSFAIDDHWRIAYVLRLHEIQSLIWAIFKLKILTRLSVKSSYQYENGHNL